MSRTAQTPAAMRRYRGRLGAFNQANTVHEAVIAKDHTPDDLLDPNYWYEHNKKLRVWDVIDCRCEDSTWRCSLRVMGIDTKMKRVIVVREGEVVEFEPPEIPDGFELEFVSFNSGWRVMQDGRDMPIASGFATHIEAAHWLNAERAPPKPAAAKKSKAAGKDEAPPPPA